MADLKTYSELKAVHRALRDGFSQSLSLRVHRALSWLDRSEREISDMDAKFIFLWIAFNAAYATEIRGMQSFSERRTHMVFLRRLLDSDDEKLINQIVWDKYTGPIRLLIDNKYVYQPFWDYQRGDIAEEVWQQRFARDKADANRAFGRMHTRKVLAIIFDRLYVLRNQLMHGCATWNGSVNRGQIRDGAALLGKLVPVIIYIMLCSGDEVWGDASYPVIG